MQGQYVTLEVDKSNFFSDRYLLSICNLGIFGTKYQSFISTLQQPLQVEEG